MVMGELQSWFHTNNCTVYTEETTAVSFRKIENRNMLKQQVRLDITDISCELEQTVKHLQLNISEMYNSGT
jgi:hypothetical protein